MLVTKTITLVASPEPPFDGTRLTIRTTPESPVYGIYSANLAAERASATIDWGDGSTPQTVADGISQTTHTYDAPGVYHVVISDDIATLQAVGASVAEYVDIYSQMVEEVDSRAVRLATLVASSFNNAANLKSVRLPSVVSTGARGEATTPFFRCTALREIHFAAANEASIKASSGWSKSPTLGAPNAVVLFDL